MLIKGVVVGKNRMVISSIMSGNMIFLVLFMWCSWVILILCFFGVVKVFMIGGWIIGISVI